ncbi:MAG: RNA-binding cell elongation regulator Jag/EloR [Clostridia bacterium]
MKSQEFTAKKVDDAIKEGLNAMGVSENQVDIEVLEQGGIFKKAKVKITLKDTEGQKALTFVEGLTDIMDVKCTLELTETDDNANIEIISVNSGAIIGHRGDVLDAIQYLASIVANEGKEDYKRIVVDCENYRARRVETLETLAKRMADKAVANERRVKLEPMNAFERRIIHAFLTNDERVSTSSFGEEPFRYLTITPKNMKPFTPRDSRGGDRGGFNRDNNRGGNFNRDRRPNDRPNDRRPDRRDDKPRDFNNDKPRDFAPKAKPAPSSFSSFAFLGNANDNKDVVEKKENKDE